MLERRFIECNCVDSLYRPHGIKLTLSCRRSGGLNARSFAFLVPRLPFGLKST